VNALIKPENKEDLTSFDLPALLEKIMSTDLSDGRESHNGMEKK
jgi:hypothetical protein